MTLNDLTVNFSQLNRSEILSDWLWLIGDDKQPILITSAGDAFLQGINDGNIYFLETGGGEVSDISNSYEEFTSFLSDKEFIADYFEVQMIGDLISKGQILKELEIYSLSTPAILGGKYRLDNIKIANVEVHFSLLGQIHKQVSELPEGTPIGNITVTEN